MTSRGNVCPSILLTFGVILFLSSFALDIFVKSKISDELGQVSCSFSSSSRHTVLSAWLTFLCICLRLSPSYSDSYCWITANSTMDGRIHPSPSIQDSSSSTSPITMVRCVGTSRSCNRSVHLSSVKPSRVRYSVTMMTMKSYHSSPPTHITLYPRWAIWKHLIPKFIPLTFRWR